MPSFMLSPLGLVPSFPRSKCKRLLNTTIKRIKLLRSRREAQIRQLRIDVAQLLKLHKEKKVQVWLGRIWKEECLLSIYIKIADYCQSVLPNLKDIAEQRECPTYLEEPLAGLCLAASHCVDLPELQELCEIFARTYGKDFVSSAQMLHNDCRLSHQFLEYLCSEDPSDVLKKALLEDVATQDENQQQEIHESSSTEVSVDTDECKQSQVQQEEMDHTDQAKDDKDEVGTKKLQEADAVLETDHAATVCDEDMGSVELANCKKTSEGRQSWHSKFRKALRKLAWRNKDAEKKDNARVHACVDEEGQGEENGNEIGARLADVHDGYEDCGTLQGEGTEPEAPNEDQLIILYVDEASFSLPPQRPPPPPPPPKRVPPLPPSL